jgi:hypothetical protein
VVARDDEEGAPHCSSMWMPGTAIDLMSFV